MRGYLHEGLGVVDDPIKQICYIPTFSPSGDEKEQDGAGICRLRPRPLLPREDDLGVGKTILESKCTAHPEN